MNVQVRALGIQRRSLPQAGQRAELSWGTRKALPPGGPEMGAAESPKLSEVRVLARGALPCAPLPMEFLARESQHATR